MIKFISLFFTSTLLIGCIESNSEKDDLLNKIEELQKSNDVLQKKNDSLSTLTIDISDVVITENTETTSGPKPSKKKVEIEKESDELSDEKEDESVANPFGGSNGGNGFSVGSSNGNPGSGSSMGNGEGKGFGGPKRENNPTPPEYDTDYSGNVCVELLINAQGKAISAKSCNSTTHPEQGVIKSVVEFVKKNVKYKAEEGAPNRKAFYTVYVQAN